ncbi:MAG: histidine phosphatase family protein [Deltaproteobacteria bacterium]|nr:histidine phosphatase family protein [Deltaproteobacteria bacterium]
MVRPIGPYYRELMQMKKTRLILVRHGRVENHATNRINGHIDVGIDELGVKQMHAVSGRLEGEAIDHVYCSDLNRCVRGAAIISESRSLTYMKEYRKSTRLTVFNTVAHLHFFPVG